MGVDGEADVGGVGAHLDGQAASATSSPALGPTMPAPIRRSVPSSNSSLVAPSERPRDSDRPLAAQGKVPLPYLTPAALASFSVALTQATSGSV